MNLLDGPIDFFVLNGRVSPGIAEFPSGASSPRKWDKRKGYGVSGGGIVYAGDDLPSFVVKVRLIEWQDWEAWDAFMPLVVKPPSGTTPKAMDIWHPITEMHGIRSVVVEDLTGPTQPIDGEWHWDIKFITYRKPKAAIAKPVSSSTKPAPAGPKAKTDADLLIERLTGQVQELSKPRTVRP